MMRTKGYAATTVADVIALAGICGRTFYEHFADLADAVVSAHDLLERRVGTRPWLAPMWTPSSGSSTAPTRSYGRWTTTPIWRGCCWWNRSP
ncbi:MAG: TetR/AcrR family transcriptional regulator [Acidimicrobiales bacterium]